MNADFTVTGHMTPELVDTLEGVFRDMYEQCQDKAMLKSAMSALLDEAMVAPWQADPSVVAAAKRNLCRVVFVRGGNR
jgi:hypothetical protein